VIRTRCQIGANMTYRQVIRDLLKSERGWRALYQGVALNVVSCVIDGWLMSTTYELAKLWADKSRHRKQAAFQAAASPICAVPSETQV
jgi:dihydroxyacetone kinase